MLAHPAPSVDTENNLNVNDPWKLSLSPLAFIIEPYYATIYVIVIGAIIT